MTGFRVFMKPGGWRVTDGMREHGPYPTYEQAVNACENLNLQRRPDEERSFAQPVSSVSTQIEQKSTDIPTKEADQAQREAIARARVGGTDSPAAGSASMGGGLV